MIKAVATASSQENKSKLQSESKHLGLWTSWDPTSILPVLVAPQIDWNELCHFWMKVNFSISKYYLETKVSNKWAFGVLENMEAPEPSSHYIISELADLPQVFKITIHGLRIICVFRWRLTLYTLKIGKPSPRDQERSFFLWRKDKSIWAFVEMTIP